jgi:hypothetical protein
MKVIINRLRWLSAGVYLGIAFVGWLQSTSKNEKEIIPTPKWTYNPEKETANA